MDQTHDQSSELPRFLATRDTPCPGCGYNLRGLTTSTCPECNQAIELRVSLSEPRVGAFLAAMMGLLAGGGMALVFLVIVVVLSLPRSFPRGREFFPVLILPMIAAAVLLGLAGWMMTSGKRRWFRGLSGRRRALVVLGCWLMTAGFVAWFLKLVLPR